MMNPAWLNAQVRERPDLFRLIHEFNRLPRNWVFPAILHNVTGNAVSEWLATQPGGAASANRWVTRELKLDEEDEFWDFEEDRRRLALLSWQTLDQTARCLGAALKSRELSALIGKRDILEVKELLGEDGWTFSLRGSSLLRIPDGVTTRLKGWEKEARGGVSEDPARALAEVAVFLGWTVIWAVFSGEAQGLRRRLEYKMPAGQKTGSIDRSNAELRDACWKLVRSTQRILLPSTELKCFA